jgi:HSP20 family protein
MSLIKWTPMSMDPFEEFDKFFDWPRSSHQMGFVPAVDVYQDNENVYVESPLPGINPNDVQVSVENDVLTIQGTTEKKSEVEDKNYYRKEVRSGSFHRAVALPASVNNDGIDAEFDNGVLKISLPKEERVKPKKIDIKIKK